MYAIVEIAGKQFKVRQNKQIYTPTLAKKEGDPIMLDKVLLLEKETVIQVGAPTIAGVKVKGKVLSHEKGDKIIVFKKKRRKGYKKTQGHRQGFTRILIEEIIS